MNNEDVPALTRATGWTRSFNPGLTETKRMLVIIIIFQPARGASSRRMQDGVGADPERGNSLAVAANPMNPMNPSLDCRPVRRRMMCRRTRSMRAVRVGYDVAAIGPDGPVDRRSYDTSSLADVKFHGLPGKRPVTGGHTRRGSSRPLRAPDPFGHPHHELSTAATCGCRSDPPGRSPAGGGVRAVRAGGRPGLCKRPDTPS